MKPGSPLPWRVVERNNARGQPLTPAIVGKRSWGNSECPIAVASAISQAETDANAAYMVHAANAYPKLIDIATNYQREIWERSSEVVDGVRTVCADERGDDWRAALALLRALGEAQ
jgi:hypothetical protein